MKQKMESIQDVLGCSIIYPKAHDGLDGYKCSKKCPLEGLSIAEIEATELRDEHYKDDEDYCLQMALWLMHLDEEPYRNHLVPILLHCHGDDVFSISNGRHRICVARKLAQKGIRVNWPIETE